MYTVFVRGIEAYAYHGVPAEERVIGHRYLVDVELQVGGSADQTDEVTDSVDYAAIGVLVFETVTRGQFQTLERLAALLLARLLDHSPLIEAATVTIEKPLPPMPLIAEAAGVTMSTTR